MRLLILALLISALAAPAGAQTPAAAQAKAADAAARPNDPDKVVCKEEPIEGTRFMTRVCRTQAAWLERRRLQSEGSQRVSIPEDPVLANPMMRDRGTPMMH